MSPDMQLLERIRRTAPEMPVLLVSGYGLEGVEEELARDPRLRYLVKPFPVHALFAEAASVLEDCVGV
jgi:DNA-binding NtrC family response regulator